MTHTPEWHQAALEHARSLLTTLQDIERRQLTDEQASAARRAALDAHFDRMAALNADALD